MCCDNHCLLCANLRIACLVFGYLSAFSTGVGSLVSTGIAIFYGTSLVFAKVPMYTTTVDLNSEDVEWRVEWIKWHKDWDKWTEAVAAHTNITVNAIIACGFMFILVPGFAFSVALLAGITQKNVTYVKAYIIYGIVLVILLLLLITILGCTVYSSGYITAPVAGVGIYSLILYMTYMQYKAMIDEIERNTRIRCEC